jgi:type II secretory pathway component PulF
MSMTGNRATVYHNLAVLLQAGVPIKKALATVGAHKRGPFARQMRFLGDAISRGSTLAEAMAARPRKFPPMDVLVVRAAETAGDAGRAMQELGEWYTFRQQLKRTIISELAYPLVIFHVAALLLPLTGLFLGAYDAGGYLLKVLKFLAPPYIFVGAIWAVVRFTPPRGLLRRALDAVALSIPLLGGGLLHLSLGRFCRAFGMLHRAGVPITQALPQATAVCGNATVAAWLNGAVRSVRQGHQAWEGFPRGIPADFTAIWSTGEESGMLGDVTVRLAHNEAEAAKSRLASLARWIPRLIYFLLMLWMAYQIVTVAKTALQIPGLE